MLTFGKLCLYWRWLRVKRIKVKRYVLVELPTFGPVNENAVGDNFPVLTRTLARAK